MVRGHTHFESPIVPSETKLVVYGLDERGTLKVLKDGSAPRP